MLSDRFIRDQLHSLEQIQMPKNTSANKYKCKPIQMPKNTSAKKSKCQKIQMPKKSKCKQKEIYKQNCVTISIIISYHIL